jgi:hypothetical protein
MANPVIQANRNLVTHGDFPEGLTPPIWKKGSINPSSATTKTEQYNGTSIRFLSAGKGSSVFQDVPVPKNAGSDAQYFISFLCEMNHNKEGTLRLSIPGEDAQEIPLRLGAARDRDADRLREANNEPLDFIPIEYRVLVTLQLRDTHDLRLEVCSPPNDPNDHISALRMTRINLQLHLPPVELQALKLDDQVLPTTQPLPLCLGATWESMHQLTCMHAPNDPWYGTRASLMITNNPQGSVVGDPVFGTDHPLGEPHVIDCPPIEGPEPFPFTLKLFNEYTAEPFLINVLLGHFRLKFAEVLQAQYIAVIEYGQSVRLGVRVASHYTDQFLEGRTVNWAEEGKGIKAATLSDELGWAYYTCTPSQAGKLRIEASVESAYYASGVVTEAFEVKALLIDPLKEVTAVVAGDEHPWGKRDYPNRGTTHSLRVKFPDVLSNSRFALYWKGTSHEQLGVKITPALEILVPVVGGVIEWLLECEDWLDGLFELRLVCSDLLQPSSLKPMSLARNLVKIGEVCDPNKFPIVDEDESVLLRLQVLHVTDSGLSTTVTGALVDWTTPQGTVETHSGEAGWASVLYAPQAAGDLVVIAKVRAHEDALPIEQPFTVKALATSPWKSEVQILFDGVVVDLKALGVCCRRGQTHTLKVVPVSGSAWIGEFICLVWRGAVPAIGLMISNLGRPVPLLAGGMEWTFVSEEENSISSLFELVLQLIGVSPDRELSGRLMSADLSKELRLRLDQVPAALDAQRLYPCLGAHHRFSVLPVALGPLVGLELLLEWLGTSAEELGATVQPALIHAQPIDDGGPSWQLDFTSSDLPGQFALRLSLPQLQFVAKVTPMDLGHNAVHIAKLLESAVNPVVDRDTAWTWGDVSSRFTGQRVGGVPVTWTESDKSSVVETDAKGRSGFGLVAEEMRVYTVQATVCSQYDGYEDQKSATITPLADDPWQRVMLRFDGMSSGLWGSKTHFPRHGGVHSIEAIFPPELEGKVVSLGQIGTAPSALDNRYEPQLGTGQVVTDGVARFALRAGDLRNGSFALRLSAERLASLSRATEMSLGPGSQVVKISAVSRADQTLLWEEGYDAVVEVRSSISGKPMGGVPVTFSSLELGAVTVVTNYYGMARVSFFPTRPGAAKVFAVVGDELNSDSIALGFTLEEPREIIALYEPIGSRLPPKESQAYAKAEVVSALTGLPLASVRVSWDYNGHALEPSLTDSKGIANLTFTLTEQEDNIVTATVEGGIGGWDSALLLYDGSVPNIDSLTCDRPVTYRGYEVNAQAMVVLSPSGRPLKGATINWMYAGLPLPDSISDSNGFASNTFVVTDVGDYELVVTLASGFPGSKTQRIVVQELQPARVYNMSAYPLSLRVGESSEIRATIRNVLTQKPLEGRKVHWEVDGDEVDMSYTDASGRATTRWIATRTGAVKIWAYVYNQNNTEAGSVDLTVLEAASC